MESEPKNYEITYLINPDISEEDVFAEAGKVTSAIQDAHGLVGRIDEPKKRRLAYPMDHITHAFIGCTTFTAAPDAIAVIFGKLKHEKYFVRMAIHEEVKRPVVEMHRRPFRRSSDLASNPPSAFAPAAS